MILAFDDAQEAMHAAALCERLGLEISGPFGHQEPGADSEPPYMEWNLHVYGHVGGAWESAERDEAEDYIESHFDREAFDRELRDGYKARNTRYE
jgi:hypothetical protein